MTPEAEFQPRDYEIKRGELEEWIDEWQLHIRPLRTRLGFTVVGAWVIPETNRFLWILSWAGPGNFKEADQAYYASAERKAIDPNPARHILKAERAAIRPVLSSS